MLRRGLVNKFSQRLLFSLIILGLTWGSLGQAYDAQITHPRLTSWTVQVYNLLYQPSLSEQELLWLVHGARSEDRPILRTMNHFWWPQTDRPLSAGLYGLLPLSTAPQWGWSAQPQSSLIYGQAFSWQQAINDYRQGRYQSALINLGHVLHLLQDMSVPAHVRNNPHELGDSFENWVKHHHQDLAVLSKVARPNCQDYYDCFEQLAQLVNQNFFSQETINQPGQRGDWPNQPAILQWPSNNGYLYSRGYRLAYYQANRQRFILNDQVHQDYWQQLSPLAVGYGVELIRLFFEAVDQAGEAIKPPSWWQRWQATWSSNLSLSSTELISDHSESESNWLVTHDSEPIIDSVASLNNQDDLDDLTSTNHFNSLNSSTIEVLSLPSSDYEEVVVERVVDGDTIVLVDGRRVRYLGIDAPELAQSADQADQCLASQAQFRNQQLVGGKLVKLVADSGGDQDSYGRLLRYVYVNNVFVNQQLAVEGLARVFFCASNQDNCPPAYDQLRRQQIIEAGQLARQQKLGLYSQQCLVAGSSTSGVATTNSSSSSSLANSANSTNLLGSTNSSTTPNLTHSATSSSTTVSSLNSSNIDQVITEIVDSVPPQTIITTDLPMITNTGTANFLFSANEPASFECQLNDQKWKSCPAEYSLKNLVGGNYSLAVRATDLAGNVELVPVIFQWTIDKQRPKASWLTKPSGTITDDRVYFAIEADKPVELWCQLDDQVEEPCPVGHYYEGLPAGVYQLVVRARDLAGNYSAKLTTKWTIKKILEPGQVIINFPPTSPWFINTVSITLTGQTSSADPVKVNGQSAQMLADQQWRATVRLEPGTNEIMVWSENELGVSGSIKTVLVILDKDKPVSSMTTLPETVDDLDFVVSWSGEDPGSEASGQLVFDVQYRLGSQSWQTWLSEVSYTSAIFDQMAEFDQKISFRCRARDLAGNWENWPANSAADTFTRLAEPPPESALKIVISQVVSRGPNGANDEFVELYNPNDQVVDLGGWRLQTKSAEGTVWINRLGSDGLPAETYIEAGGYLLLTSADYSRLTWPDYRHQSNWGLADQGGHLRLVNHQGGIADQLGYNQADQAEGQPAIADLSAGYSLQRKATAQSTAISLATGGSEFGLGNGWDTDNNQADFVEQTIVLPRSGNQRTVDHNSLSLGLTNLWHFDECRGLTTSDSVGLASLSDYPLNWQVGRFGCAVEQTWEQPEINLKLSPAIDPMAVTLAYWWKNSSYPDEGRAHEFLKSSDGQIVLGLTPSSGGYVSIRYYDQVFDLWGSIIPDDQNWHLLALTQDYNQLKFYVDGQLGFEQATEYSPPRLISQLNLADENFPVTRDQLAIWQRALSWSEINQLYHSLEPLSPYQPRPPAPLPVAIYHWAFDEGDGQVVVDNLANLTLGPINRWVYSPFQLGARLAYPEQWLANFNQPLDSQDISLSFWWRNCSAPNEGRAELVLYSQGQTTRFGLTVGGYGLKIHFNQQDWYPRLLEIAGSDWHQVVLSYDSYRYQLSLYLDGQLFHQEPMIWLTEPLVKLLAHSENYPIEIDEISLWQGSLSAEQVETIYELARPNLELD